MNKLADKPFFNIISLEQLLVSDASLNDLFYQVRNKQDNIKPKLSGKVILINTGSLKSETFDLQLAKTLEEVNKHNPKVTGLDILFDDDTTKTGYHELITNIQETENLILARNPGKDDNQQFIAVNSKKADVNFPPEQSTIRLYSADTASFAYQVSSFITDKPITRFPQQSFFLNYLTDANGYFSIKSDEFIFYNAAPEEKQFKFLKLEAIDIVNRDPTSLQALKQLIPGRAVLIGHLENTLISNPAHDIEDKHRVPCDPMIVNRDKTMSGLLIHANAIENILNPEDRFFAFSNTFIFAILKEILIILFLYHLIFTSTGKATNTLILIILSILSIYLTIYLMSKHIYVEIGLSLLQFLVIEEIIEVFHPIYLYIHKKFAQ